MISKTAKPKKTAVEYAAYLLGVRMYSTAELRKKMLAKEYPFPEIRSVIEDFTRKGYLNDALYAENLSSSLAARGDGKRKIAGKLRMKGIAPELIEDTLEKLDSEVTEEEAAWQALQKKRSALLRESDPQKRKEKAVRYLSGHGFSAGAAFTVWERFLHEREENC